MRILRPEQIELMRLGMPCIPVNGGGGGSTSSSSAQSTTTNNTDKRIASSGGVTISSEGSNINVQSVDKDIVNKAFDTVAIADAQNGEGFGKLLSLADKIVTGGGQLLTRGQDQVLQAAQSVQAEKQGSIDQKTIMILGVAAAAAFAMRRK
jgi:hypothetical protein